ncbi:MAG: glycine cleavage system aminomethyltransferase GcvT [Candidatus Methylomirabilia bacterium]
MSQSSEGALRRTPLYPLHVKAGAKMVQFGGWEMPVQYSGIIAEHRAVRARVGLFDVSHMGEFEVAGPEALLVLGRITTNDVAQLEVGRVQYSLLCTPEGGIVDDLTVYRLGADRFMLTVNAANIDKDWAWVTEHGKGKAEWRNVSTETALLAVQGPRAEKLLQRLADRDLMRLRYYCFEQGHVAGIPALISRTGYTGEDGFELYMSAADAERGWFALLQEGEPDGIVPVGLGARDTLRLEMRYALYGNDIDETTTPLEAGLGWVVKLGKGDFIGRQAIEREKSLGVRRKLVGFEMVDQAVARHGYRVLHEGREVGVVTSGSYGPSVDRYIGLGYVPLAHAEVGSEIEVEVRGTPKKARIAPTPFCPSNVKKG